MARAKQNVRRRKRLRETGEDDEAQDGEGFPKAQALPIATLPDDFDGEVEDGATYLALALRANASLPFVSRVHNPYRQPSPPLPLPPGPSSPGHDTLVNDPNDAPSAASSSRHPALPKDSWEVLFPLHFLGYRKHLAVRWPPSPPHPYPSEYPPLPPPTSRSDWYGYINGFPRQKVKKHKDPIPVDADEEAMINAPLSKVNAAGEAEAMADDVDLGKMTNLRSELEDEEERHGPREPLVCVLQSLNSTEMTRILSHIARWMNESTENFTPNVLLPTQPTEPSTPSTSSPTPPSPPPNPFPARYARWTFALLCVIDTQLSGGDISTLRELARAAMKVGGWRWIRAVTNGEISEDDDWVFGGRWKIARDGRPSSGGPRELAGDDETGVDETLARCWMVVHAVAVGWGQRDLVAELYDLFT